MGLRNRDDDRDVSGWGASAAPPSAASAIGPPASAVRPRRYGHLIPSVQELRASTFVAVDFETANRRGGVSACQVALVKFSAGRIVDRLTTYLCPPVGWDAFEFTYIHGITSRETAAAPSWHQVAEKVADFVDGAPVYAHNAAFDRRVWQQLDEFFALETIPQRFYCSYRLARRAVPGLVNYKLPTVTHACAPDYVLDHHRAESDAEACGLIVASIQARAETPGPLE